MTTGQYARSVFEERAHDTVRGFSGLLRIEAALRQLIQRELQIVGGQRWHRERLPGDLHPKIQSGLRYERTYKWLEFIPHSPLCYLDFPDLCKIIVRSDNWGDCFASFFGNKEQLQAKFRDAEYIRNKIAHSRLITAHELQKLASFETEIRNRIGNANFDALIDGYLPIGDIPSQLTKIAACLQNLAKEVCDAKCIALPAELAELQECWWLDPAYVPIDSDHLSSTLDLLHRYVNLPREHRDGYRIESWLKTNPLPESLLKLSQNMLALAAEG